MKKIILIFVFVYVMVFNISAANKKAHQQLREAFENYAPLPALEAQGFDLKKLDKINGFREMVNYLMLFLGENQDNYAKNQFLTIASYELTKDGKRMRMGSRYLYKNSYVLTHNNNSRVIKFTDEYGTKEELLAKGYVENETMFRCPFYGRWVEDTSDKSGYSFSTGKWQEDGYRVGKCYMIPTLEREVYDYISDGTNCLVIGITEDTELESTTVSIKNSEKDYLILDLTYSQLKKEEYIQPILEAIKEMNPKEILVLISSYTAFYSEVLAVKVSECWEKVTKIGQPTKGACYYSSRKGNGATIDFGDFEIRFNQLDKKIEELAAIEGFGITPDFYTIGDIETVAVVNHLIGKSDFDLQSLHKGKLSDGAGDYNMMIYLGQKHWAKLK